ncbi:MAG: glycosyltransferase family 2 protein [Mollicutes bacterium]|nr:glycosyltransferase family 2 protein [Mollicutes bacterium]
MKKLSIIIPLYNTPLPYFKECLDSCCINDEVEIIVVDDGSTLNYENLLKRYDLKYVKIANGGVSKARNVGMLLSTGEYITFLDSDDVFILNQSVLDFLNKKNIIIARNFIMSQSTIENYYLYDKSQIISQSELKRNMFLLSNRSIDCIEPVWSKFYLKSYLQEYGIIFNERLRRGEDVIFNYEAYSRTKSVFYCNEFSYKYRMTNMDSITRSFDKIMVITTFQLLEEFEKLFRKLNTVDENYQYYVWRLVIRLIRKYYVYLSKEEFNTKVNLLFSNIIIDHYLNMINHAELDEYKKQLYEILVIKDKAQLYSYLRDVCDKKLLRK